MASSKEPLSSRNLVQVPSQTHSINLVTDDTLLGERVFFSNI